MLKRAVLHPLLPVLRSGCGVSKHPRQALRLLRWCWRSQQGRIPAQALPCKSSAIPARWGKLELVRSDTPAYTDTLQTFAGREMLPEQLSVRHLSYFRHCTDHHEGFRSTEGKAPGTGLAVCAAVQALLLRMQEKCQEGSAGMRQGLLISACVQGAGKRSLDLGKVRLCGVPLHPAGSWPCPSLLAGAVLSSADNQTTTFVIT